MVNVHFKFSYADKTYRFPSISHAGYLLITLRLRVAEIVKDGDCKLCWKKGDSTHLLETEANLCEAMEHARRSGCMSPCVRLVVVSSAAAASTVSTGRAAESLSAAAAVIQQTADAALGAEVASATVSIRASEEAVAELQIAVGEAREDAAAPAAIQFAAADALDSAVATTEATLPVANGAVTELKTLIGGAETTAPSRPALFGKSVSCSAVQDIPLPQETSSDDKENVQPPLATSSPLAQQLSCMNMASTARNARRADRRHPTKAGRRSHPYSLQSPRSLPSTGRRMSPPSSDTSSESSESVPMEIVDEIVDDVVSADAPSFAPRWLLMQNRANDCFLNAALQYMRRARDLWSALAARVKPEEYKDQRARCREIVLRLLEWLMKMEGVQSPAALRTWLPDAIKDLEENFLTTQQDAYEILTKIFDDVIPESIEKMFHIESASRRRCRDDENCKGSEQKQSGPIYYQHIERRNQILDLEAALSSDWTAVEGETEPRHCSECCPCCQAKEEGHDEDKCKDCKADRKHYVEENCFRFKGDSEYALVAFNILHHDGRVDWALKENCDLDGMTLMGHYWKAVSVIKHSGSAYGSYSRGHYVTYTREDDGNWWLHDDDEVPVSIGDRFVQNGRFSYGEGITDMEGIVAILFQKIF